MLLLEVNLKIIHWFLSIHIRCEQDASDEERHGNEDESPPFAKSDVHRSANDAAPEGAQHEQRRYPWRGSLVVALRQQLRSDRGGVAEDCSYPCGRRCCCKMLDFTTSSFYERHTCRFIDVKAWATCIHSSRWRETFYHDGWRGNTLNLSHSS
jgi:hypothetical protein